MATTPRPGHELVAAPARTPIQGGLFDALPGQRTQPLDGHALGGIYYPMDPTADAKLIPDATANVMGTASKGGDFGGDDYVMGEPFTIFTSKTSDRLLRSPEQLAEQAEAHLVAASQRTVEQIVWSKLLPGSGGQDLNPAGAVSTKDAVGILEEFAGSGYFYTPTLHFGRRLAPYLADHFLVKFDEAKAAAIGGALAVNGSGYTSLIGPGGVQAAADERWMWITGQVAAWEGAPQTHSAFDQNTNKIFGFSERTYIITADGLAAAVRVKLS